MNRPQRSDSLTLDEATAAMQRMNTHPEYIKGYRFGFLDYVGVVTVAKIDAYRCGVKAGRDAWARGAHR